MHPVNDREDIPWPVRVAAPDLAHLSPRRLKLMGRAARVVERITTDLEGCGVNVVADILRGHEAFTALEHYPPDDARDAASGCSFFYHAHDPDRDEHGHFHPFVPLRSDDPGGDLLALPAISMNVWGRPRALFTVNQWVTGGSWLPAAPTIQHLNRYRMEHAYPSWLVNRWITALLHLLRPHIEQLLWARDVAIRTVADGCTLEDVLADRRREVITWMPLDMDGLVNQIQSIQSQAGSLPPASV